MPIPFASAHGLSPMLAANGPFSSKTQRVLANSHATECSPVKLVRASLWSGIEMKSTTELYITKGYQGMKNFVTNSWGDTLSMHCSGNISTD